MFKSSVSLSEFDPEISAAIEAEKTRQEEHIELIASENHTSPFVMEAQGSVLTNKYAEGYPSKRYYGGCENVDVVEELAIKRAKELFNADYANVQPHSGSQANTAVFHALINPGDKILGFDLSHGGHLTHGSPVNFSGRIYNASFYGVNKETGKRSDPRLQFNSFQLLDQILGQLSRKLSIQLDVKDLTDKRVEYLKGLLDRYKGDKHALGFLVYDNQETIKLEMLSRKLLHFLPISHLEAFKDLCRTIKCPRPGEMHCFSVSPREMRRVIDSDLERLLFGNITSIYAAALGCIAG